MPQLELTRPRASPRTAARARARRLDLRRALSPAHLALAAILALSAVMNTYRLSQNGWGNSFYSASVKSMLGSLHNFLFASFDQAGLVTIDKPPLGVWVQVASAKLFGFAPLSLLLPEALLGTLTVAALYVLLVRRVGVLAALTGALVLAVFPVFVAVSRDNGVDPLLVLLMLLACGGALRAIEGGRLRWLLASAALVGLAFNTKTLAAYLVVPGIALAYLVCAPQRWPRRVLSLLAAGLVLAAVSFSWIALVELTPASQRPYVGSSTNNTEIGLTFEYNGFGRVEGEVGGPGHIPARGGALVHSNHRGARAQAHARAKPATSTSPFLPNGRYRNPIAFGGPVGPLRLFGAELSGQGAWMLPLALFGMLAFAWSLLWPARGPSDDAGAEAGAAAARENGRTATSSRSSGNGRAAATIRRTDPQLALLLALGGWLLVEFVVLSWSKGIVHPYYISALAPPAAAMAGAGVAAMAGFARPIEARWDPRSASDPRALLLPLAVAATVAAQIVILEHQKYMQWYVPVLIAGAATCVLAIAAVRRLALPATVALLAVLLAAPAAYSATTWLAPGEGTFPAAGPHEAVGQSRYGAEPRELAEDRKLVAYVAAHRPGSRWSILADAAPTAAPMILLGSPAGAMGGYGGTDPVLDGRSLARLVQRGQARYVVLGGAYASRGGNKATSAVLHHCRQVPHQAWQGPPPGSRVLVLFDCAGRERELRAALG